MPLANFGPPGDILTREQTISHFITYSVITAKPELTYSSVVSTIRLYPVTSGSSEGSTFIEWSGNFSSDADAGKPIILVDYYVHWMLTLRNRCHPGC